MRILLVSYAFPPTGGAGVGRALKLCKYWARLGVKPAVVTVSNPSVPVEDPSLLGDLPPQMEIFRVPTLEPGYWLKRAIWAQQRSTVVEENGDKDNLGYAHTLLRWIKRWIVKAARTALVLDPQALWLPGAIVGVLRAIHRYKPDVIVITGPPFSQFLLGPLIAAFQIPLVLDYRDEWATLRSTYEMSGTFADRVGSRLESWVLGHANAVVTATEAFRVNLLSLYQHVDPTRVHTITNGYDPEDYRHLRPAALDPQRFTITYAGTLFRLTSPAGFLDALEILSRARPDLSARLRVRFIGRIVSSEEPRMRRAERELSVEIAGYVKKEDAMQALVDSHLTLCLLSDLPENRRIYPAKVFELMAIERPCLTVTPEGALAELARSHKLGPVFYPREPRAIADWLADTLEMFVEGRYRASRSAIGIAEFHRRAIAEKYLALVHELLGTAQPLDEVLAA